MLLLREARSGLQAARTRDSAFISMRPQVRSSSVHKRATLAPANVVGAALVTHTHLHLLESACCALVKVLHFMRSRSPPGRTEDITSCGQLVASTAFPFTSHAC
jgi:hypothetical protein